MNKFRKIIDAVRRALLAAASIIADEIGLREAHVYGGLIFLGYGLHMVYPPAALVVCGLLLFWMGVRR